MTFEAAVVLIILGLVFVNFIRERFPPDVIAMAGVAALLLLGALSPGDVLGVFSNHAPITIGAMFVLSAALEKTGVINSLGQVVTRLSGGSLPRTLFITMIVVMGLSAFMNNTPVVVIMTPVLLAVARSTGMAGTRLLIPLSYAAIMGGTCTLIGTSTNLLVDGVAQDLGMRPFGMYEITGAGLIMAGAGMLFLITFGHWLLPARASGVDDLMQDIRDKRFLSELQVTAGSDLDGRKLEDTILGKAHDIYVLDVIRDGYRLRRGLKEIKLRPGDRILVETSMDELAALRESGDVAVGGRGDGVRESQLVEAIIGPDSMLDKRQVGELNLHERFGVHILAVHRQGRRLSRAFDQLRLYVGDTLLLAGAPENLKRLYKSRQFADISIPEIQPLRRKRAWIAMLAMALVMVLAGLDVMPIVALALIAAVIVVITGCVTSEEAYDSVQWPLLILIFAMLAIGTALQNSGAALMIARALAEAVEPYGPLVVLSVVYLLTSILTETMSNNAAVILLTPIAAGLALTMGFDPRPFVVAVMFAGSASFATPIGYQTNTFVYQAGNYRFTDFVKIGVPMNILLWIVAVMVIPIYWPLVPGE